MKLMTAFALTLISTVALAGPAVNDSASYDITVTQGTQSMKGTQDLAITAYDEKTKLYTIKSTLTFNGQAQTQQATATADKLYSDELADQLISTCESKGGKVAPVTVAAGTFSSCTGNYSDNGASGTVSYGKVPFNLIRMEVTGGGQTMVVELRSYKRGQ